MGVVTHKTTSTYFPLIKRRLKLQISLPQALTCCAAVAVVVEKFGSVGWLHGGTV